MESDVDDEKCPKCGGDLTFGYGLAAGPMGGYVLCMEDGCDYEKTYPDKSVEQPTDPNAVTCLHQVK